jgi:hypothetical protein
VRFNSRILVITGAIAAAIAVGILVGWWASRSPAGISQVVPPPQAVEVAIVQTNRPIAFSKRTPPKAVTTNEPLAEVVAANTSIIANWEDRIDELLKADTASADKAKLLLALFPRLPEEGQAEAAQHLANLLPNEEYAALGRYLADAKTPAGVLAVLMADVLNRPNVLKLPLLLEVARNPDHAKAADAKSVLELYLEHNYGTNWDAWQSKMEDWLKNNPD